MADVQEILRDVQTFAPIIETALGLSSSVAATITTLTVVGEGIANFMATIQSQVNTVSAGGSVDFASLNANLDRIKLQVSTYITSKEQPPA